MAVAPMLMLAFAGGAFVSAGATGEGAFTSEVAMRDQRPGHVVMRPSKAPQGMQRYLKSSSLIVLEDLPGREKVEHLSLLNHKQMINQYSDEWTPVIIEPNDSVNLCRRVDNREAIGAR
jgi:hypothetical protein